METHQKPAVEDTSKDLIQYYLIPEEALKSAVVLDSRKAVSDALDKIGHENVGKFRLLKAKDVEIRKKIVFTF